MKPYAEYVTIQLRIRPEEPARLVYLKTSQQLGGWCQIGVGGSAVSMSVVSLSMSSTSALLLSVAGVGVHCGNNPVFGDATGDAHRVVGTHFDVLAQHRS